MRLPHWFRTRGLVVVIGSLGAHSLERASRRRLIEPKRHHLPTAPRGMRAVGTG